MLGKLLQINVFGRCQTYEPKLSGGLQGETRRDCPLIMSGTKKGQTRRSYVTGNAWRDDMMGGKLKDMHACGEIPAWHDTSRTAILLSIYSVPFPHAHLIRPRRRSCSNGKHQL